MTVLESIQRSTEFLARKGVDSPRLQTELLLAHVLRLPRLRLYLEFQRQLREAEVESLRDLVRRRGNREPLQHLLGTTSFCGYDIAVTRDVLIPRPETEQLAERAWTWLNGRGFEAASVLDVGTGSGCLAVTLALRCPGTRIVAVDLSEAALAVARANAQSQNVADRIEFRCGDLWAAVPPEARFHLLVSNPPYIPSGDLAALAPEVRDHEPRLALDGGADGLAVFRRLAKDGRSHLTPGGRLFAEFGDDQGPALRALFVEAGWQVAEIARDDTGRERFLVADPQVQDADDNPCSTFRC